MSELKGIEQTETDPEILINAFLKDFSEVYNSEDKEKIDDAWNYLIGKTAALKRNCGRPYYIHPLRVARILAEKHLGADTIVAGLFHNILDVDNDCLGEIEERFGKEIANICKDYRTQNKK